MEPPPPYTKLHAYARTGSVRTKYKVNKIATYENHCLSARMCNTYQAQSQETKVNLQSVRSKRTQFKGLLGAKKHILYKK